MLLSDERIDQLSANGIQIIQSKEVFSFSLDAVLLANFPALPKQGCIVDLCAGNGAVGLFMSAHTQAQIIQIELQPRLADMGKRSIALNQLTQQVHMHTLDLKNTTSIVTPDSADLVVCNPPYFKETPQKKKNPNEHLAIARHEIHTNLQEVVTTAAKLLKTNGRLAMVHRPDRFLEIIEEMKRAQIAPKRVQFVYPKPEKEANILLIEGIKYGKLEGFKCLPPFFVHNQDNQYQPEMQAMLFGN